LNPFNNDKCFYGVFKQNRDREIEREMRDGKRGKEKG
jgi:hypothetical protein